MAVDRDYRADMDDLLRLKVPESDFIPAVSAAEVVAWLRAHDPDLLEGWLDLMAMPIITRLISHRLQATRARLSHGARARIFADAANRYPVEGASVFDALYAVDDDNLRRSVRNMTKGDHLYVAAQYAKTEKIARMEAAFHRAIAKRIPPGSTTEDVMDEETYLRLYESITGTDRP